MTTSSTSTRMAFRAFVEGAIGEAEKAIQRYPQPNYVISKLAEEAGEAVKAAIHCAEGREPMQSVRDELRQVIAMAYRLWVEGDQVHGLPPVAPECQITPAYSLDFPDPDCCTAWEDCYHDGICHDPFGCGAIGPNQLPGVRDE